MNKSDFVDAVARDANLTKADAARAVDAFAKIVEGELGRNGEVRLVNFGTFLVVRRKETEGRNPRTGETIKIPSTLVPRFKPGKGLKEAISGR